uniref:EamA domain-containing protein n=1 Tax=Arion vulgaris TaxID=1028688 RepID=A0A0B6Z4S3_9EUPU
MEFVGDASWLVTVALFWGATNPLLKYYSVGVENIKRDGKIAQFVAECSFLFLNWKYLLSFFTNQMGSVIYYITLSSADVTLAVPITNSLTFIFTALSSRFLGEKNLTWDAIVGMILIISGVSLCVLSKVTDDLLEDKETILNST